jgi:hypothetical protein
VPRGRREKIHTISETANLMERWYFEYLGVDGDADMRIILKWLLKIGLFCYMCDKAGRAH